MVWDKLVEAFKAGKTDLSQVDFNSREPWTQARVPIDKPSEDLPSTKSPDGFDAASATPKSSASDASTLTTLPSSASTSALLVSPSHGEDRPSWSRGMPEKKRRKPNVSQPPPPTYQSQRQWNVRGRHHAHLSSRFPSRLTRS
jgi:hypothetical protein